MEYKYQRRLNPYRQPVKKKRHFGRIILAAFIALMVVQFFWPGEKDSQALANSSLSIYAPDDTSRAVATTKYSSLGITVSADSDKTNYPWYLRIVPTSIFWKHAVQGDVKLDLDSDKAKNYLDDLSTKVAREAGTTTTTNLNFVLSKTDPGVKGRSLNVDDTLSKLQQSLQTLRDDDSFEIVADYTDPDEVIDNTFGDDDASLSAVIKNYADSHSGTYGVAMVELDGKHRYASYNGDQVFMTASTYKLFVAVSTLQRIESGTWNWGDSSTDGYTKRTCFDRMIELSDNDCAQYFLFSIGFGQETAEAHALGAIHTTFQDGNITSTPDDELLLLGLIGTGQILSDSSRDILISAMKQNVYLAGIPSGLPNIEVADKVGFLQELLHDAAIVYSPKGTYALVIMTADSSWANIAGMAAAIEAAR